MIDTYQKLSKCLDLNAYCHHAKDHDFLELTEWHNGEGFDVTKSGDKFFSFTWGEWEALQALVAYRESKEN
jgi:hypothetical protein